jgi:hypothetical protein
MISTKVQYFERIETPQHLDFVQNQGHCVLCRNVLELKHFSQKDVNQIKEEAFCSECDVKTRAKIYTLN